MRKLLLICLIFLSFNSFTIKADSEDIISWGDFNVKVKLNQDLQEVLSFIKSNIKLKEGYYDPEFYIENNYVNYTTQSAINTNHLKTYRLDHRAVSPKYRISAARSYYLHVVDITPPEVISMTGFKIAIGGEKPDYLQGLVVIDNYTNKEDINIKVDESNIDYSKIGTYEILYTISDCSGNTLFYKEYLEIVDLIKPTISKTKDLILQVGTDFDLDDYFQIKDNYDVNPSINVTIAGDINTIGEKEIMIKVTDQSGNVSEYRDVLKVVDKIAPKISLKEDTITVNLNEEIDLLSLIDFSDNYDDVSLLDIVISSNIDYSVVDSYEVLYELTDSSNNKETVVLTVLVRDLTHPVIEVDDMNIPRGKTIDFLMYAKATDNYSEPHNISLDIIYNNVLFDTPGTYFVTFRAIDEHGNHTDKTISVTVAGKETGEIIFYFLLSISIVGVGVIVVIFINEKRKKAN